MKKRNIALAVGLALTMSVGSMALVACKDETTPPSPFEDDTKFAAVPATETTHFLAGQLSYYGGNCWGTDDNKPNNDKLRFSHHTEDATLYKLSVVLMKTDKFKIRYEGMPWGDGVNKGNIPADKLIDAQRDDANGDIVAVEDTGGKAFQVAKDGTYEIWLTMTANLESPLSVQYVRKGDAPAIEWSHDVYVKGAWDDDWSSDSWIRVGATSLDKNNKTVTADINIDMGQATSVEFGFQLSDAGQKNDKGFGNSTLTAGAADGVLDGKIVKADSGDNYKCTASGTYNVTVTLNDNGGFESVTFNSYTAPAAA